MSRSDRCTNRMRMADLLRLRSVSSRLFKHNDDECQRFAAYPGLPARPCINIFAVSGAAGTRLCASLRLRSYTSVRLSSIDDDVQKIAVIGGLLGAGVDL